MQRRLPCDRAGLQHSGWTRQSAAARAQPTSRSARPRIREAAGTQPTERSWRSERRDRQRQQQRRTSAPSGRRARGGPIGASRTAPRRGSRLFPLIAILAVLVCRAGAMQPGRGIRVQRRPRQQSRQTGPRPAGTAGGRAAGTTAGQDVGADTLGVRRPTAPPRRSSSRREDTAAAQSQQTGPRPAGTAGGRAAGTTTGQDVGVDTLGVWRPTAPPRRPCRRAPKKRRKMGKTARARSRGIRESWAIASHRRRERHTPRPAPTSSSGPQRRHSATTRAWTSSA